MKCKTCGVEYYRFAHKKLYDKEICNNCCPTAGYENNLFKGCDCVKSK